MDCSTLGFPCSSPTSRACSNSCPSSQWCHPIISSSVIPFSSCPQYFPASESFPMSQLFTSGGQSIGASASAPVLPVNTQDWFPLGWTGLISLLSKGLSRVLSQLFFFLILFYFLTLQYCIGFSIYRNESTTGLCVFPILNPPPSSLPIPSLWVVPVHQPQASSIVPAFALSSFTFIKRLFSSSSLSAIRVVSSVYLRLLIFLPAILIPVCASFSPAFHVMYSAYKLNKQGDNIQPWCTPFPIWNQSAVPFLVLTVASWPTYRFLISHNYPLIKSI